MRIKLARDCAANSLSGTPVSAGVAVGTVRIIRDATDATDLHPGDVLVCGAFTPQVTALLHMAAAIVTETGGPLSNPAVVAREHRLPAVFAVARATQLLVDGQRIAVDGARGLIVPSG